MANLLFSSQSLSEKTKKKQGRVQINVHFVRSSVVFYPVLRDGFDLETRRRKTVTKTIDCIEKPITVALLILNRFSPLDRCLLAISLRRSPHLC